MREIDELGVFWLEGSEEDQLSGRLRFDPREEGITLSLVGAFDSVYRNQDPDMVRILGWIGTQKVTLEKCFSSGIYHKSPGVDESNYRANELLLGYHAFEPTPEFQSATVSLSDLSNWVGRTGITEESKSGNTNTAHSDRLVVRLNPLQSESFTFSRGEVSITYSWESKRVGDNGIELKHWPSISVKYAEKQTLSVVQKDVGRIQDLVTLCIDTPVSIDRLVLRRPDVRVKMLSGVDGPEEQRIDFISQPLRYSDPIQRKPRQQYKMLLTYEELGGVKAIAKWLDSAPTFQQALDSLMSVSHVKQMFAENRFLNVTFAAEAFHRITLGGTSMNEDEFNDLLQRYVENTPEDQRDWLLGRIQYANEPSLSKRLRQLASRSAPATRILIKDKARWSHLLAQFRNELTHLAGSSRSFGGSEIYFLTESVYAVVRVCMLLECGVDPKVLKGKAESETFTWYKPRLENALQAVRRHFEKLE